MMNARLGLALFASAAIAACGTQPTTPASNDAPPTFAADDANLIGGFVNTAKSLDAVGTVGFLNPDGSYEFICTATLIGPRTVLSAKHCAVVIDEQSPIFGWSYTDIVDNFVFAVGPDATKPTKIFKVIDTSVTEVKGGNLGLGLDISVFFLGEDVTGVTPLAYATTPLTEETAGAKLVTVGYGTQDLKAWITGKGLDGLRRAGTSTQGPLTGNPYTYMGYSLENYLQGFIDQYGEDFLAEALGADWKDQLTAWYNEIALADGWESLFGAQKGDAQIASGDSGGPTFRKTASAADSPAKLEIVAITSWGLSNPDATQGGVLANFGSELGQKLLSDAASYTDPCEGLTAQGQCNGTVATRCRAPFEGPRRKLELDCASLLLDCATDATGTAVCVDPATGETTGGTDSGPVKVTPPTTKAVKIAIARLASGVSLKKISK